MIHVDRKQVSPPQILTEPDGAGIRETKRAEDFFADPKNREARFEFAVYRHDSVKDALARLFHGKCAYCESRYGATQPMDVEHFKPKAVVTLPDGREIRPGYYWLGADWGNLFPSCIDCNRARCQIDDSGGTRLLGKANQFPLEDYQTVKTWNDLRSAIPVLINPNETDPKEHLEFMDQGFVKPAPDVAGIPSKRGAASIDVFALNRMGLALARREHARIVLYRLNLVHRLAQVLERMEDPELQTLVEDLIAHELYTLELAKQDDQPYAQLTRQLIDRYREAMVVPISA